VVAAELVGTRSIDAGCPRECALSARLVFVQFARIASTVALGENGGPVLGASLRDLDCGAGRAVIALRPDAEAPRLVEADDADRRGPVCPR